VIRRILVAAATRAGPGGRGGAARPARVQPSALDDIASARLLTPEDVAELLRVDRETIYRMARRGELPAIKVARHWRFRAARIDRWLRDLESGEG
jgi:excisionase family DNA binding protein